MASVSFPGFQSLIVEIMAMLAYICSISQGFIGEKILCKKNGKAGGLAYKNTTKNKVTLKSLTNTLNYDKRL
jgi:hypothetical protein